MRVAVLSDIHANLPALHAVAKDLEQRGVTHVWSLGDVVGYGGSPREVVAWVANQAHVALLGNHDHAVLHADTGGFNRLAAEAVVRNRELLDEDLRARMRQWQPQAHARVSEADVLLVHASPDDPLREYVFAHGALRGLLRWRGRARMILMGHTHQPFAAHFPSDDWKIDGFNEHVVAESDARDPLLLLNPGSVGQPRDGDPRASYAVVDFDRRLASLHRVAYDVDAAADAIRAAGLPEALAARLHDGV